ncbi:alpha/beta hydrolase [Planktomarina sp.]|nr:alpha/beta hydrolase [Planktomarina sp.]
MKITLNDTEIFASTGGREFDPSGKTLMFIHGSGQSHLGFMLQHRFFANRGWQCVTPDMPGHGLSSGKAFKTVEEMADWYASFMQAVGIKKSSIIGHSMGGLITLELASRYSDLVSKAVFISTALAISVNDTLIDMAANDESKAIAAMMDWAHGSTGHKHQHTVPGTSHMIYGSRVMASNASGSLHAGLSACKAYTNGPIAAADITCPTLTIICGQDKMTPRKTGLALHSALGGEMLEIPQSGHMSITEQPIEVNKALQAFF